MESQIVEIHKSLKSGAYTCTELIGEKIKALEGSSNNSSNFILRDLAFSLAKMVDDKINKGEEPGILGGVPFGLKDVYMLQGYPATGSSAILRNYISPYTATVNT
jgi:aspartyl-tRNA(Asn)/glutamyl-tRNA(Gln) amidotransferase subunit A